MQKTNSLITKRPRCVVRKADDALGDYQHRFKAYLQDQGYRPATVAEYVRCIDALRKLMQKRGVALVDLGEAKAADLLAKAKWSPSRRKFADYIVRRFSRFLIEQGVLTPPAPSVPKKSARVELRQNYEAYLRHQRGLSDQTIFHCWWFAERFLEFRFGDKMGKLSKITPTDIAGFLQQLHSGPRPYRVKTSSSHLRNFFRYLFKAGKTKTNLALGILSVAQRYGTRLPRHLTPEQVETVIAAVYSDTPRGRRNHAMVVLLARLGLRAPEVIAMQIDDIDWRAGEIIIRGKGQFHDRVPLPQDVGKALADYIRVDRVTTSRALFVTDRAPHGPFKDGQLLNAILKDAFARTGMKWPARYVGSHVLRHSLATNLVQRGASLEEIANVLRHRSRATTMHYAKLDIDGLRSVAQPWPVTGGAK